ncbi:MAG: tol-pal system YbgF family protein [Synechococcus sp.]
MDEVSFSLDATQSIGISNSLDTIGYKGLGSSYLWLNFIQYFGSGGGSDGSKQSANYLNALSQIEPRFIHTYTTAMSAVAFRAGDPESAIEILETGIEHITPDWSDASFRVPFQLAIIHFLFQGDFEAARDNFYLAAERYKSQNQQAATLWRDLGDSLEQNPDSRRARFNIWQQVYNVSSDEDVRAHAYTQLVNLGEQESLPDGSVRIIPPPR